MLKARSQQDQWENAAVIIVAIIIAFVLVTMCFYGRIKQFFKARCYSSLSGEDNEEDGLVTVNLEEDDEDEAPKPNEALISDREVIWLYASHALQAFGDRLWQFAIPIMFMLLWTDTLFPTAIFQFSLSVSSFVLTAPMGNWIDRNDRLHVFKLAVFGQNIFIVINCVLVWMLAYMRLTTTTTTTITTISPTVNATTSSVPQTTSPLTFFEATIFILVLMSAITAELGGTVRSSSYRH